MIIKNVVNHFLTGHIINIEKRRNQIEREKTKGEIENN